MIEPKPYIELADFPKLTPFTEAAIRNYMARGELVEGVHFFRSPSRGEKRTSGRPIFKWSAIEEWIEARSRAVAPDPIPRLDPVGDIVRLRQRA
jgi:hypothetical protein